MTWAFQIAINILKCHVGMLLLCWPLLFSRIIILDYVPIACPCAIMNNKKWVQMWQVLYWDQNQGHSSAMQQDFLHFPKLQELLAFAIYTFVLSHYTMKNIPWQILIPLVKNLSTSICLQFADGYKNRTEKPSEAWGKITNYLLHLILISFRISKSSNHPAHINITCVECKKQN